MKAKKAILGLAFSAVMLLGMSSMQKATEANIAWGISALFDADDNTTSSNVVTGAAAGAGVVAGALYSGAQAGATVGAVLGPLGVIGGAVAGGL